MLITRPFFLWKLEKVYEWDSIHWAFPSSVISVSFSFWYLYNPGNQRNCSQVTEIHFLKNYFIVRVTPIVWADDSWNTNTHHFIRTAILQNLCKKDSPDHNGLVFQDVECCSCYWRLFIYSYSYWMQKERKDPGEYLFFQRITRRYPTQIRLPTVSGHSPDEITDTFLPETTQESARKAEATE